MRLSALQASLNQQFETIIQASIIAHDELTLTIPMAQIKTVCTILRDDPAFDFKLLLDVCGVDYLHYGLSEWATHATTASGFGRGVTRETAHTTPLPAHISRFAVVYHLLSLTHRHRLRVRVPIPASAPLIVDSVIDIWPAADWFERETFDLFGILFRGHPDLRRLLTDYGFQGHPFRKDFPLIGEVEARYDATLKRVVYESVNIEPRILEPKVIRTDHRYLSEETHD